MGHPDLNPPQDPRGLVIFPASLPAPARGGEWWLVWVALAVAGVLIAIAFAIR